MVFSISTKQSKSMTKNPKISDIRFAFFGTSHVAAHAVQALFDNGCIPALVVTPAGKPQGRSREVIPCAVEEWAISKNIPLQHDHNIGTDWDVCIVADYGRILKKELLDIPRHGFLNIHPSLLPRLRGPSPMRTAILTDEQKTGVTIIKMDEQVDHGPIIAQKEVGMLWPPHLSDMEAILMQAGGTLLAQILPEWVAGTIEAREQNHDVATFTKKFEKEDGLLDLKASAYENILTIRAFEGNPGTHAFFERNGKRIRVQILDAELKNGTLEITRVKPEGKGEMDYDAFLRGGAKPI